MISLCRLSKMNQQIICPIFHAQGRNTGNIIYHYLSKQFQLSDATVVVGDVSDEASILNAAFLNKKVYYRLLSLMKFDEDSN